jgi:hypothetical protein
MKNADLQVESMLDELQSATQAVGGRSPAAGITAYDLAGSTSRHHRPPSVCWTIRERVCNEAG